MFASRIAPVRFVRAVSLRASAPASCFGLRAFPQQQQQLVGRRWFSNEAEEVAAATESDFRLHFATPYDLFYDKAPIHEITIPTVDGNYTLGANSAPYLAQLKPGRVVVYRDDTDTGDAYVIPGGYFVVNRDGSVSLSVPEALSVDQIDIEKAKAGQLTARRLQSEGGATEEAKVNQWYGEIGEEVYNECVFAVEENI